MTSVRAIREASAVEEIRQADEVSYSVRECARCGAQLRVIRGILRVRWICEVCGKRAH